MKSNRGIGAAVLAALSGIGAAAGRFMARSDYAGPQRHAAKRYRASVRQHQRHAAKARNVRRNRRARRG